MLLFKRTDGICVPVDCEKRAGARQPWLMILVSAKRTYTSSLARLRNGFEVDRNMRDRDCKRRIVLGNVAKGMSIGTVVKDSDLPTHS